MVLLSKSMVSALSGGPYSATARFFRSSRMSSPPVSRKCPNMDLLTGYYMPAHGTRAVLHKMFVRRGHTGRGRVRMGPPLLVKRNISGRAGEGTRPYGGHRSLPFFFVGAGHRPARRSLERREGHTPERLHLGLRAAAKRRLASNPPVGLLLVLRTNSPCCARGCDLGLLPIPLQPPPYGIFLTTPAP